LDGKLLFQRHGPQFGQRNGRQSHPAMMQVKHLKDWQGAAFDHIDGNVGVEQISQHGGTALKTLSLGLMLAAPFVHKIISR